MAFIEMNCGSCESGLQVDTSDNPYLESQVAIYAERFANAHATCGYMTALPATEPTATRSVIRLAGKARQEEDGDEVS